MKKVIPLLFMVFTLVFQISIPTSVLEFNNISPDVVTDLADFSDNNDDPSDDVVEDNNLEVEVLYPVMNLGHYIQLSPIQHIGDLHSYFDSYIKKLIIPPSV